VVVNSQWIASGDVFVDPRIILKLHKSIKKMNSLSEIANEKTLLKALI
jgi:hypothetical protein